MQTREETEGQIAYAVDSLMGALEMLSAAVEATTLLAQQEAGSGHDQLASIYLNAQSALENLQGQIDGAIGEAEQVKSNVAQAQGV